MCRRVLCDGGVCTGKLWRGHAASSPGAHPRLKARSPGPPGRVPAHSMSRATRDVAQFLLQNCLRLSGGGCSLGSCDGRCDPAQVPPSGPVLLQSLFFLAFLGQLAFLATSSVAKMSFYRGTASHPW